MTITSQTKTSKNVAASYMDFDLVYKMRELYK